MIELANADQSNYEEDEFEEKEKVVLDPVTLDSVKQHFAELAIILQIKKIKKGDSLKYILHGVKDPETGKKSKIVNMETMVS